MKAVLKFLLNTGAGKMIVQAIVAFVIKLVKKRLEAMPDYQKRNTDLFLDIIHGELHADIDAGKIKPVDML